MTELHKKLHYCDICGRIAQEDDGVITCPIDGVIKDIDLEEAKKELEEFLNA